MTNDQAPMTKQAPNPNVQMTKDVAFVIQSL
jgi:hypothetical protein